MNFGRNFGVCTLCCAPLRADFEYASEIVNEVLFGDTFEVLEQRKNSLHIALSSDGYKGWIEASQSTDLDEKLFSKMQSIAPAIATDMIAFAQSSEREVPVPRGATLRLVEGKIMLGTKLLNFSGQSSTTGSFSVAGLEALCRSYLGTPYRWGGRSPWGIDCSGLVQMVYRIMGVALPRDTSQQIKLGAPVASFEDRRPGDLVFATSLNGGFSHVGIAGTGAIVFHSSGLVREDELKSDGFYDSVSGVRSHEMREMRRILP